MIHTIPSEEFENFIFSVPELRKSAFSELRRILVENLPEGFTEILESGMFSYVVPLTLYPNGYHAAPGKPLPFVSLASQKNYIALYHMALYADEKNLTWFRNEYSKYSKTKLDMGKSCIRFKNTADIPYELIAQLVSKITPQDWISIYESKVKPKP